MSIYINEDGVLTQERDDGQKGRGLSPKTIAVIEAARKVCEEIEPATVRAACYRLFIMGLIESMAKGESRPMCDSAPLKCDARPGAANTGAAKRRAYMLKHPVFLPYRVKKRKLPLRAAIASLWTIILGLADKLGCSTWPRPATCVYDPTPKTCTTPAPM